MIEGLFFVATVADGSLFFVLHTKKRPHVIVGTFTERLA